MPTAEDRLSPELSELRVSPGSPESIEEVEKDGENWHLRQQVPRYAEVSVLPEGIQRGSLEGCSRDSHLLVELVYSE